MSYPILSRPQQGIYPHGVFIRTCFELSLLYALGLRQLQYEGQCSIAAQ